MKSQNIRNETRCSYFIWTKLDLYFLVLQANNFRHLNTSGVHFCVLLIAWTCLEFPVEFSEQTQPVLWQIVTQGWTDHSKKWRLPLGEHLSWVKWSKCTGTFLPRLQATQRPDDKLRPRGDSLKIQKCLCSFHQSPENGGCREARRGEALIFLSWI